MPITAITIENFKGIQGPVRIDLKPITLLFGPNSAGKSTVLHALQYAYEIFCNRNFSPDRTKVGGEKVDLGGFPSFVHKHNTDELVTLRLDYDFADDDVLPFCGEDWFDQLFMELDSNDEYEALWNKLGDVQSCFVTVDIAWHHEEKQAFVRNYYVGINNENIAAITCSTSTASPALSYLELQHPLLKRDEGEPEDLIDRVIQNDVEMFFDEAAAGSSALPKWGEPLPLTIVGYSDEMLGYQTGKLLAQFFFSSIIVGAGELIRDALASLKYLGPIREIPARHFAPQQTSDFKRVASGLAAWDAIGNDRQLRRTVNKWLTVERLNIDYAVETRLATPIDKDIFYPALKRIMKDSELDERSEADVAKQLFEGHQQSVQVVLYDNINHVDVAACDVGVGISQVLPVITEALNSRSSRILEIEQPELHVHPKLQVELADLFISQVNYVDEDDDSLASSNNCFILETHSEHLMLRLMKRMRQTSEGDQPEKALQLTEKQLAVYAIETTDRGTVFKQIRLDEDGEFIDRWPNGFFSERRGELL